MDHLELLDGGLFAESNLLDDIPAQKPRSADLADLPMSAAGGMPVPIALKVDVGQIVRMGNDLLQERRRGKGYLAL